MKIHERKTALTPQINEHFRHYYNFTSARTLSPPAVDNRFCVDDGRPHPHHTDADIFIQSVFKPSIRTWLADSPPRRTNAFAGEFLSD